MCKKQFLVFVSRLVGCFVNMRFFLIILICCCAAEVSLALSYGTASSIVADAMACRMDDLRKEGKKVPQTWEEMEVLFGVSLDERFNYVLPTQRYAFITNDVRIGESRILLMMRSPFHDGRLYRAWYGGIAHGVEELGRWVIVQDAGSVIRARYIGEEMVVSAFARAGVSLPAPDGLGEWRHEVEYRETRNTNRVLGCIVFFASLWFVFLRRRVTAETR
jgi:hypothetical protein